MVSHRYIVKWERTWQFKKSPDAFVPRYIQINAKRPETLNCQVLRGGEVGHE